MTKEDVVTLMDFYEVEGYDDAKSPINNVKDLITLLISLSYKKGKNEGMIETRKQLEKEYDTPYYRKAQEEYFHNFY